MRDNKSNMAAQIVLKKIPTDSFNEPEVSIDELKDFDGDSFSKLVLSLRGFAYNASMLIFGYHYFRASEYQIFENVKKLNPLEYTSAYYKFHAFQGDVLLRLRKACEYKIKSMAAGTIFILLEDENNIEQLRSYIKKDFEIVPKFDNYIKYIQKYCGELVASKLRGSKYSSALLDRIDLIKRMTNKEIAHITLDGYKVRPNDIHQVFIAVLTVACTIQTIMGSLACETDPRVAENMACETAYQNVPSEYNKKYASFVLGMLPEWVEKNLTSKVFEIAD